MNLTRAAAVAFFTNLAESGYQVALLVFSSLPIYIKINDFQVFFIAMLLLNLPLLYEIRLPLKVNL